MGFLVALVTNLIEWLLTKFGSFIEKWVKQKEVESQIEHQAQTDEHNLENAHTVEEKQDAAENIINHTFNH